MKTTIIAAFFLAAVAGAQPIPPVEHFPFRPYQEPPTPAELAAAEALAESNALANVRQEEAIMRLADKLGIQKGSDAASKLARAEEVIKFCEGIAENDPMQVNGVAAGAAAVAAGIAAYLSGKRGKK